jgi:hypothetical protein
MTETTAAGSPRRHVPWWVALVTGAFGIGVGIAIGVVGVAGASLLFAPSSSSDTRIIDAATECGLANKFYAELGDENQTISIDAQGDESGGASYAEVQCILQALAVPQSVLSHFEQTTAMDGRQIEEWDGITLSWSYHPDRGPDCVITTL